MFKHYYFYNTPDQNNFYEVHTEDCYFLPAPQNRTYIGYFDNCAAAISAAKSQYPSKTFDGCFFCCTKCHKG